VDAILTLPDLEEIIQWIVIDIAREKTPLLIIATMIKRSWT
jgi:hypothetical protein